MLGKSWDLNCALPRGHQRKLRKQMLDSFTTRTSTFEVGLHLELFFCGHQIPGVIRPLGNIEMAFGLRHIVLSCFLLRGTRLPGPCSPVSSRRMSLLLTKRVLGRAKNIVRRKFPPIYENFPTRANAAQ